MCFQRWWKQTKHEKSFEGPVATLLPPFSTRSPPPQPQSFSQLMFFFLSLPPLLRRYSANHFFQDKGRAIVPPPGWTRPPPPHTDTHAPPLHQLAKRYFSVREPEAELSSSCTEVAVYCDKDDVRRSETRSRLYRLESQISHRSQCKKCCVSLGPCR